MLWGGTRYAEQYADRVLRLYQVEAHDVDRSLTRAAIHPLAEALLIPDTIFVATMTGSPFYRGRLRQELNVRRSRGDRLVRAIITRFELVGFGHRVRFHARMTEGTARILSRWRRIVPGRWRGTRRDRELRRVMTEFIDRAIHLAPQRYDELVDAMTRIDEIAQSGRLRRLPRTELRGIMRNGVGTLATGTDVAADAVADDASEA